MWDTLPSLTWPFPLSHLCWVTAQVASEQMLHTNLQAHFCNAPSFCRTSCLHYSLLIPSSVSSYPTGWCHVCFFFLSSLLCHLTACEHLRSSGSDVAPAAQRSGLVLYLLSLLVLRLENWPFVFCSFSFDVWSVPPTAPRSTCCCSVDYCNTSQLV
jgi:hypothetical protein